MLTQQNLSLQIDFALYVYIFVLIHIYVVDDVITNLSSATLTLQAF